MPYQMFRVVDGKIIEEDEATVLERERKLLEGIVLPVVYTCLLCNIKLHNATTKAGLYNHWKAFHCDETDDDDHSVDGNSETGKIGDENNDDGHKVDGNSENGKTGDENDDDYHSENENSVTGNTGDENDEDYHSVDGNSKTGDENFDDDHKVDGNSENGKTGNELSPGLSLIQKDEKVEHGKGEMEPSCEKTIPACAKPLQSEDEEWEVDEYDYYPKDIFTVKRSVIHQDMGFKISPSSDKELPIQQCCMHEIKNNLTGEIMKASCGCDCLESEDLGPMPKLSPQCSPSHDMQIDDNDTEEEMTEVRDEPEEFGKKRKKMSKRPTKKTKAKLSGPITKANLYDAMRRGERLWWCKLCDDYFKSVEILKYHVAKVHNEDMTKINRFNIATWDLEIARTFTSPYEIELEYQLNLQEADNHSEQSSN